jgi:hypothetical protein
MTTFSEHVPEAVPPNELGMDDHSEWFAHVWMHESEQHIARTAPVIAVVRELAATLRDEQFSASQAHRALRRAVNLLAVFAGGNLAAGRQADRGGAEIDSDGPTEAQLAHESYSQSGESTRFAKAWLLDSPADAIRTAPVIAVVEQLLGGLIMETPAGAHADLRQALRMLRVFAREEDTVTGIARSAELAR